MKFAALRALTRAPKKFRWNENGHCYWCGKTVAFYYNGGGLNRPFRATREHIVPKSRGGGDGGNRVTACLRCNQARDRDMRWVPFHQLPEELRKNAPFLLDGSEYREALR